MALQQEVRPPSAGLRRALGGSRSARSARTAVAEHRGADPTRDHRGAAHGGARTCSGGGSAEPYPQTNGPRAFNAVALGEGPGVRTSTRPMLYLLAVSVALVLLIACANVTSLLVARSVSTAARNRGSSGGRRQPDEADPAVADRVGPAGAARRPVRARAGPVGCAAPPCRGHPAGDRSRRQLSRAGLHLRRCGRERHPVRARPGPPHPPRRHDLGACATKAARSRPASARRDGGAGSSCSRWR